MILNKFVGFAARLSLCVSILNHILKFRCRLIKHDPRTKVPSKDALAQSYVVAWTAILAALFFCCSVNSSKELVGVLTLIAVFYRLEDLVFASLDDGLGLTDTYAGFDWRGRILILLANLFQIVVIFAVAFRVMVGPHAFDPQSELTHSRLDYFILSWNSLPLLGGLPALGTHTGKVLAMSEAGVGMLVGVIALGVFLGRESNRTTGVGDTNCKGPYGSLFSMKPKPGSEHRLREAMMNPDSRPPGVVATYLLTDRKIGRVWGLAVFQNEQRYREDWTMPASRSNQFSDLRNLLDADPELHDGPVVQHLE